MKTPKPIRTERTLLCEFVERLLGPQMRDQFIEHFHSWADPKIADREMSEEEYQFRLQKMVEELPAFGNFLHSMPQVPREPYVPPGPYA